MKVGDRMKIAKLFSAVFGVLGAVVMVFSIGLCLLSLNRTPVIREMPEGAVLCSETLMEAFLAGDYAAASEVIYGQPELGSRWNPQDFNGQRIREAYISSLDYAFQGECYATDSGLCRDVSVTYLDISSITDAISRHAHGLMTDRVASAQTMDELYDASGNFRPELVQGSLDHAVTLAMAEGKTVTKQITLKLICRDGQWWAVPEDALLTAMSGGGV